MKPIRSGFDGLEFAIKAHIPPKLEKILSNLKEHAQECHGEICARLDNERLTVRETGARGGYAYSCRHEETGDWFFKKPSQFDPWGIRFSASSSALVLLGLEGLRLRIAKLLVNLGIEAPIDAYRPSRIDFAIDFLAPDFEVCADNFVMHSRSSRKAIYKLENLETNGRSSRTTSVTVGKMPYRQVIIYDKREEIMVKGKTEWCHVWARAMHGPDSPPVDLADRTTSQIWRVELRVAKRHLKDVWDVNSWASLYEMLHRIFLEMLADIRYCAPSSDPNRARWPNHEIWDAVAEAVANDLFDYIPTLSPETYVEIKRAQKIDELLTQVLGLAISLAAIESVAVADFGNHIESNVEKLLEKAKENKRPLKERLAKASDKYRYLVSS